MIEKLKQYQQESGKSWYRIAKELEIPGSTVRNWALGTHKPCNYHNKIIKKYLRKQ